MVISPALFREGIKCYLRPYFQPALSDFELHPRLILKFPKISKIPDPSVFPHLSFQEGQVSPTRRYKIGSVGDSSATAKTEEPCWGQQGKIQPDKKKLGAHLLQTP